MSDFGILNWSILITYVLLNLLLGWVLSKKVDTAEDFYLGRRTTPWWAIGISVIATYVSALSFLGGPAWSYSESLAVIAIHLNYPIVVFFVITLFLPFFFNSGVASIYDYMENRFGPTSRLVISSVFLVSQALTSAAILYATSLVIEFITGIDVKTAIVIVTVVALIYTMMGGITAVIWTDVIQAGVLFVGAFIILFALLDSMPMPIGEVLADLKAQGKTNPLNFSFDLSLEATVWSGVIAMSLFHITVYGANQMMVQRTLAAKNIGDAKKSFLLMGFIAFFIYFLFFFLGILFYGYYGGQEFENGNTIILDFAANYGLPGLMGIIAAAIVAASMSTLDSSFNSLATISTVDFYQKYFRKNESPEHYLTVSRVFTVFWADRHHRPGHHVFRTGRIGAANAEQNRFLFCRRQAQHVWPWLFLETDNGERAACRRCVRVRHGLVPLDANRYCLAVVLFVWWRGQHRRFLNREPCYRRSTGRMVRVFDQRTAKDVQRQRITGKGRWLVPGARQGRQSQLFIARVFCADDLVLVPLRAPDLGAQHAACAGHGFAAPDVGFGLLEAGAQINRRASRRKTECVIDPGRGD